MLLLHSFFIIRNSQNSETITKVCFRFEEKTFYLALDLKKFDLTFQIKFLLI